jgi:lycopene cyclase domain-containing protein
VPEYTLAALAAAAAVIALELGVWRTGIFRMPVYWVSAAIVFGFQVLVNGWLSRLTAPTFFYNSDAITGVRFPWDIPVEDLAYGWALVTLAIVLWERARERLPVGAGER